LAPKRRAFEAPYPGYNGGLVVEARSPSHAARLVKTLVVAGASLGLSGCGGESRRTVEGTRGKPEPSGLGGMGGVAGLAQGGRAGGSAMPVYTGDVEACSSAQRVCSCTYQPPLGYTTCTFDHPFGYLGESTTYQLATMDCQCDEARPAGPEDCAYTEQFTCTEYTPEYEACFCDLNAPITSDDCPRPDRFYQCNGLDPDIGCYCITRIK